MRGDRARKAGARWRFNKRLAGDFTTAREARNTTSCASATTNVHDLFTCSACTHMVSSIGQGARHRRSTLGHSVQRPLECFAQQVFQLCFSIFSAAHRGIKQCAPSLALLRKRRGQERTWSEKDTRASCMTDHVFRSIARQPAPPWHHREETFHEAFHEAFQSGLNFGRCLGSRLGYSPYCHHGSLCRQAAEDQQDPARRSHRLCHDHHDQQRRYRSGGSQIQARVRRCHRRMHEEHRHR
jgi:hypothetical protein